MTEKPNWQQGIQHNINQKTIETSARDDALGMYLKEIAKYPLLNWEEEVELAKRQNDEAAKKKLVESNLRLVVSIAKRFVREQISLLDLIQDGNLGLMKAVEKFDYTRGCKFSTFATSYIRSCILDSLAKQECILKTPRHVIEEIFKFRKASRNLEAILQRAPSLEEVAKEMNISVEQANSILFMMHPTISFEELVYREGRFSVKDIVTDEIQMSIEEEVLGKRYLTDCKEHLNTAIQKLNKKERKVIIHRFGLNGEQILTCEELGTQLGVSFQRISQLEKEAIEKLKRSLKRYCQY